MIQVLVMANDSLLADHIVTTLSREADLDVFRITRDELGVRRDYSVVIVLDEEMDEHEPIQLKEIMRHGTSLLLIRVSLKNRNVYVDESYQLANPGITQIVDLLKEFSMKNRMGKSAKDVNSQKKMNDIRVVHAGKYYRQTPSSSFGRYFAALQVMEFQQHLAGNVGDSEHGEIPMFFYSFFLHYLRLQNPANVTLPVWQEYSTRHRI